MSSRPVVSVRIQRCNNVAEPDSVEKVRSYNDSADFCDLMTAEVETSIHHTERQWRRSMTHCIVSYGTLLEASAHIAPRNLEAHYWYPKPNSSPPVSLAHARSRSLKTHRLRYCIVVQLAASRSRYISKHPRISAPREERDLEALDLHESSGDLYH